VQVLTKLNTTKLLWTFAISQLVVITIYLGHRAETFVTFDHFLQSVKYSTLILLVISILIAIKQRDHLLKFEKTKYKSNNFTYANSKYFDIYPANCYE